MKLQSGKSGVNIALPVSKGYRIIRFEDIVKCQAAGNYTTILLADGQEVSICKRLKDIQAMLPPSMFCRVHQSHIVNLERIEMWIRGQKNYLILSNNLQAPVSKANRKGLKSLFDENQI